MTGLYTSGACKKMPAAAARVESGCSLLATPSAVDCKVRCQQEWGLVEGRASVMMEGDA